MVGSCHRADFTGCDLETDVLQVRVEADLRMAVTDRRTGWTWRQATPPQGLVPTLADIGPASANFTLSRDLTGAELHWSLTASGAEVLLTVSAPAEEALAEPLVFPAAFLSRPGGLLMVPYAQGLVLPVDELELAREFLYAGYKATMGWCGVTNLQDGYMLLLETPADGGFRLAPAAGGDGSGPLLAPHTVWTGEKGRFGYERRVRLVFLDRGGHVAMCQRYRRWAEGQGYVKTLRDKARERPLVDRLIGAVDFWGREGTNDAAFYAQLPGLGIDRAICSLGGGWIAPRGVADLVDQLNAQGYLPSHYDLYTDVWPGGPDDEPRGARKHGYPEDVYVKADGSPRKGWVIRAGHQEYQGYYLCATQHAKEAAERIAADLAESAYPCRFIDVVTAMALAECYSPEHPVTLRGDLAARQAMLALVSGHFGLVTGSEESRDWAIAVTDYAEGTMTIRAADNAGYDWQSPVEESAEYAMWNAGAAYRAPLHALCWHDCHVATWYTGDGATKVPSAWARKDLLNLLYGTMPLWMPDAALWRQYRLGFIRSYANVCSLFRAVGYDALEDHRYLSPDRLVQRSVFSSGTVVTVNFTAADFVVPPADSPTREELVLPPLGYAAHGPAIGAFRARVGADIVNYVETGDRVLVDSPGVRYGPSALETEGSVLLFATDTGATLLNLSGARRLVLREEGPLLGRSLGRAQTTAVDAEGARQPVALQHASRAVSFDALPGIERYEIIYPQARAAKAGQEAGIPSA